MLLVTIINGFLVIAAVLIHYEMLQFISRFIPYLPFKPRFRIAIGVLCSLAAHVIEIWMFGLAYYWMIQQGDIGSLEGNFDGSLLNCVYFSFTTYSTLGFGDIAPLGDIRFLVGLESLTGLVLITWTASFLFIEMQKQWQEKK